MTDPHALPTLLAEVVALNTLVFLGLLLGKVIPWPREPHPRRLRRLAMKRPSGA